MSDERADLILSTLQTARREKLDEIIIRLGRLVRRIAGLHSDYADLSVRLDNLDRRVGRIERRLELADVPVS